MEEEDIVCQTVKERRRRRRSGAEEGSTSMKNLYDNSSPHRVSNGTRQLSVLFVCLLFHQSFITIFLIGITTKTTQMVSIVLVFVLANVFNLISVVLLSYGSKFSISFV